MSWGIVYLLQPYEFIGTDIYKIGCSCKENDISRCTKGYIVGSIIIYIVKCNDPLDIEREIKIHFSKKFKLVMGREYFEGDETQIKAEFEKIVMEDTRNEFVDIPRTEKRSDKFSFRLTPVDICEYIVILAGHKFIYSLNGDKCKLRCFNSKFWQNDDIPLKNYLSNDLYNLLLVKLRQVCQDPNDYQQQKLHLNELKTLEFKQSVVETYKKYCVNHNVNHNVKFDKQWWLLGFNNSVYDLNEECFREYKYTDYISITTSYDWREPTQDEINTVNTLINQIMPVAEERKLYLQILCTALEGRSRNHFYVFHGNGGNGKGMINDMLRLALGNYGSVKNDSVLHEMNKTGYNPEKFDLHHKRLMIIREPSERNAKSFYDNNARADLQDLIMIIESNKRPQCTESNRLIDLHFRSRFTTNKSEIDNSKNIYVANAFYKTKEFQEQHKFALMRILFDAHKQFKANNYMFDIPKIVAENLEPVCDIIEWFRGNYCLTNERSNVFKIKDMYDHFRMSTFFDNLTKQDKKIYSKKYFVDCIAKNIFFKDYYRERHRDSRNVITCWAKKI